MDFLVDDGGTVRFGRFGLIILLKLKVCTIEKMVSDNNGGFTPNISLKKKPEEGPWQQQAINPVVLAIRKTKTGPFGPRSVRVRPEISAIGPRPNSRNL